MGLIENGSVCFSYLGDMKLNPVGQTVLRISEELTPESVGDGIIISLCQLGPALGLFVMAV